MRIIARHTTHSTLRTGIFGLTLLALVGVVRPAFAGPPLLCHAFDIGTAKSLPWSGASSWYDGQPGYDLQKLAGDTEALLTPATPVIVRMETLRRAAIYASRDPLVAKRLFLTISDRVRTSGTDGAANALALFDAGYLTETFKEIGRLTARGFREIDINGEAMALLVKGVDGYAMVQKSLALRADDASIEFASALIAASTTERKDRYALHAEKARAGAKQDALLAKNLKQISE
jgi:hypothetical protein